eukprot:3002991-Prymnesium_polylepis.1
MKLGSQGVLVDATVCSQPRYRCAAADAKNVSGRGRDGSGSMCSLGVGAIRWCTPVWVSTW